MAWQLTASTALLEDPSWVPGTNLQPSLTLKVLKGIKYLLLAP